MVPPARDGGAVSRGRGNWSWSLYSGTMGPWENRYMNKRSEVSAPAQNHRGKRRLASSSLQPNPFHLRAGVNCGRQGSQLSGGLLYGRPQTPSPKLNPTWRRDGGRHDGVLDALGRWTGRTGRERRQSGITLLVCSACATLLEHRNLELGHASCRYSSCNEEK